MNLALWITAGLLAVIFLAAGGGKLIMPKEKLAAFPGGGWVEDFSAGSVKTIGVLEVLAAVGLILPAALDIAPVLVPLAAVGLVLVMVGAHNPAAPPHNRRAQIGSDDPPGAVVALVGNVQGLAHSV
jgi:DoxX-like family